MTKHGNGVASRSQFEQATIGFAVRSGQLHEPSKFDQVEFNDVNSATKFSALERERSYLRGRVER